MCFMHENKTARHSRKNGRHPKSMRMRNVLYIWMWRNDKLKEEDKTHVNIKKQETTVRHSNNNNSIKYETFHLYYVEWALKWNKTKRKKLIMITCIHGEIFCGGYYFVIYINTNDTIRRHNNTEWVIWPYLDARSTYTHTVHHTDTHMRAPINGEKGGKREKKDINSMALDLGLLAVLMAPGGS